MTLHQRPAPSAASSSKCGRAFRVNEAACSNERLRYCALGGAKQAGVGGAPSRPLSAGARPAAPSRPPAAPSTRRTPPRAPAGSSRASRPAQGAEGAARQTPSVLAERAWEAAKPLRRAAYTATTRRRALGQLKRRGATDAGARAAEALSCRHAPAAQTHSPKTPARRQPRLRRRAARAAAAASSPERASAGREAGWRAAARAAGRGGAAAPRRSAQLRSTTRRTRQTPRPVQRCVPMPQRRTSPQVGPQTRRRRRSRVHRRGVHGPAVQAAHTPPQIRAEREPILSSLPRHQPLTIVEPPS
jgi:hypothetical protein